MNNFLAFNLASFIFTGRLYQLSFIAIARALYRAENYVFLDEMTSALDDEMAMKAFDLFKKMTLNSTIVVISHDQRIINRCDNVIDVALL